MLDLWELSVTAARPCPAGVPTQSPVAGAPAVPHSGAALDLSTALFGNAAVTVCPVSHQVGLDKRGDWLCWRGDWPRITAAVADTAVVRQGCGD